MNRWLFSRSAGSGPVAGAGACGPGGGDSACVQDDVDHQPITLGVSDRVVAALTVRVREVDADGRIPGLFDGQHLGLLDLQGDPAQPRVQQFRLDDGCLRKAHVPEAR